MSTTVVGRNDLGLTIETIDNNGITNPNTGVVAVAVGISAIAELPGSTNAQEALQALATGAGSGGVSPTDLASTASGKGASMVGIHDTAGRYTGTTVEAAFVEVPTKVELASTAAGKGASGIGVQDSGAHYAATNVEDALSEVALSADAATIIANAATNLAVDAGDLATAAQQSADLKAPIDNPVFTGVVRVPNAGASPTIGWNGNGGAYGFRYDDDANQIEVWRAGAVIALINVDVFTVLGDAARILFRDDTAFGRDSGGGFAYIANALGCRVAAGLSEWGHAIPASQPAGGVATAGGTYGATEQTMLQTVYDALRDKGTIS